MEMSARHLREARWADISLLGSQLDAADMAISWKDKIRDEIGQLHDNMAIRSRSLRANTLRSGEVIYDTCYGIGFESTREKVAEEFGAVITQGEIEGSDLGTCGTMQSLEILLVIDRSEGFGDLGRGYSFGGESGSYLQTPPCGELHLIASETPGIARRIEESPIREFGDDRLDIRCRHPLEQEFATDIVRALLRAGTKVSHAEQCLIAT